jgi:hypothetical protein
VNLSALVLPVLAAVADGRVTPEEGAEIVESIGTELEHLAEEELPDAAAALEQWVEHLLHPDPEAIRLHADELAADGHDRRAEHLRARAARIEARRAAIPTTTTQE